MNFISCNTILIKTLLSTIVLDIGSSFTIKHSGGKHSNPHSLNHNQNYNKKSFVENYYLPSSIEAEDTLFWRDYGFQEIKNSIEMQESSINTNIAKNIILFIGDGMSNPTISAARILKGIQEKHPYPERGFLSFERFPHLGRIKTFNVNEQTPDSASTATAIYSGIKTLSDTLGFDSSIIYDNATSMLKANKVETILSWAQEAGKDTGFVTTARVTHATPAALYAHSANRDWECQIPEDIENYEKVKDIAWQLINTSPGNRSKVIMGGGYPAFYPRPDNVPRTSPDEIKQQDWDNGGTEWSCFREDGENLVQKWLEEKKSLNSKAKYVRSNKELQMLDINETDHLLGLFGQHHLRFGDSRVPAEDPTVEDMTMKAIEVLQKSKNGFFLMVEGARIDQAHHENWAQRALNETVHLNQAVERAISMVNISETLIIVTADHSHNMVFSGYATRGSNPTGLGEQNLDDDLPYTLMTYSNGPGFTNNFEVNNMGTNVTRMNLSTTNFINDREYRYSANGLRDSATHGGDDVNIFAIGPMAHLFSRTHDQTHVANVMAYSACIGPYRDESTPRCTPSSGSTMKISHFMLIFILIIFALEI